MRKVRNAEPVPSETFWAEEGKTAKGPQSFKTTGMTRIKDGIQVTFRRTFVMNRGPA